ncbi:Head virion protein G6P [Salmonella enterica subsp. houtenae]|nr:Head virion protein G6P [Salmonella enterica subsp. houtenae]EEQ0906935.1 Head virion protein G6P [Salmonella enterica subsp. houtenae]
MPFLLGIPALLRFLIGLVPLSLGYIASFLARLAAKTGIIAFALVTLITSTVLLLVQYLSEITFSSLPADFSHLIASVLPDHFHACVNVIMVTRISVLIFDLKEKFLDYANRVI